MYKSALFAAIVLLYGCEARQTRQETTPAVAVEPEIENERPAMTFTLADGGRVNAQEMRDNMVLVLFQPDCDHCQEEARLIKNRIAAFKDYDLYFISSHPMDQIVKFAKDYGLAGEPNVHFGWTSDESVLTNFGAIATPSIYIYTKEGRLVESFEGQTDVEKIISYL